MRDHAPMDVDVSHTPAEKTAPLDGSADLPAFPVVARDRMRLILLVGMLAIWAVPKWTDAQVGGAVVSQSGGTRTGLLAAAALLALWGLSTTSLAARRLRGLRAGLALVSALIAVATTWLLATKHPWIPGGALRETWAPVFGCLGLMAVIEAVVALRRPLAGPELAWLRAGTALVAAAGLFVAGAMLPAGVALWLAATAVANAMITTAHGARRALEACALLGAIVAGFAPSLHGRLVDLARTTGIALPQYAWVVLAAVVATTAVDGILRPAADPDDAR